MRSIEEERRTLSRLNRSVAWRDLSTKRNRLRRSLATVSRYRNPGSHRPPSRGVKRSIAIFWLTVSDGGAVMYRVRTLIVVLAGVGVASAQDAPRGNWQVPGA